MPLGPRVAALKIAGVIPSFLVLVFGSVDWLAGGESLLDGSFGEVLRWSSAELATVLDDTGLLVTEGTLFWEEGALLALPDSTSPLSSPSAFPPTITPLELLLPSVSLWRPVCGSSPVRSMAEVR